MTLIPVQEKVLNENQRLAAELRRRFTDAGVFVLNLISSPGSGKTSLLERTLESTGRDTRVAVLTGDIQTENDARRLARFGFPVQQITTGGTCHLDARMVTRALEKWRLTDLDILFIENVGNLVCPSSYDLGEHAKVVLLSVTEGEDKPLKYPSIFAKAEVCVLNKTDLLPYVRFDLRQAKNHIAAVHPGIYIVETCCNSVDGVTEWIHWVNTRRVGAFPTLTGAR
jgi:hydrogenase nickel incorporation protein HypB